MVSAYPPISISFSPLIKPLGIVQSAPITIDISITFMFNGFLVLWLGLSTCNSFCFLWFSFCGPPGWQSPLFGRFSFLCFTLTWSGLLARIRWSVCISKSQRILWVSFSSTDFGLFIHHLVEWTNFSFLHNSQWFIFPPSCVLSYTLFLLVCSIHLL